MDFRKDYRTIVQCLEMKKTEKRNGDSKDRLNAADAEKFMIRIPFAMSSSYSDYLV